MEKLGAVREALAAAREREKTVTDVLFFDQNGHVTHSWPSETVIKGWNLERLARHTDLWPHDTIKSTLGFYSMRCTFCGESPEIVMDDSGGVKLATPCEAVNGVFTKTTLNVPSGRIVVADDLRPIYDFDMDDIDYNTRKGQAIAVERMAAVGCAYGPVGNTCPSLYKMEDGTYQIANSGVNWETDEEIPVPGVAIAWICTDLWAYSIADYDDYVAKGGKFDQYGPESVEIEPGTYEFEYHGGERSFDSDSHEPVIFATIRKVL